jgi:DNA-binding NtrC family response regulator
MAQQVLLVDDERAFLEAMAERMATRGIAVSTASSAEEAIVLVENKRYDAIILDFQMPGMDGLEAVKIIKAKQPDARIILLTGYATVEKKGEAIQAGAFELLEKPPDLNVMLKLID